MAIKIKRKSEAQLESEDQASALTQVASLAKKQKRVSAVTMFEANQELERVLATQSEDEAIWIHNCSGTEYHIPPITDEPKDSRTAIVFEVSQVRNFTKADIVKSDFKKALLDGRLQIVDEKDARTLEKARIKSLESSDSDTYDGGGKKKKAGLYHSGLPVQLSAAMAYIWACEDEDELEQIATMEDRDPIINAIDDRLEDLAQSAD